MNPTANAYAAPLRKGAPLARVLRWFSSQCVLRPLEAADVPRLWQALLTPACERCYIAPPPASEAEVAEFVRTAQADWARGTRYVIAVQRRQTQALIGWIEARAHPAIAHRGVWTLDWFFHPGFIGSSLPPETLVAASDLLMNAVGARLLSVDCPAGHALFETWLAAVGFARHVPAGSLDPASGAPRADSLYVMTQRDWRAVRGSGATGPATLGGYTEPKLELTLV
jgi:RimJ/RimL family protein N-acetyltransferase